MNVIIYTKTGCPWCKEALRFLSDKQVPFEDREIFGNPVFFEELKAKSGQSKTPTVDVDGDILADTDAEAIEAFLKQRGIL
ncbi:MAG: glutaredoxin family protein [Candidatus Taylorbacteria bacterium]|nr:glutaredoxin family protein [Candidatus Taylorbacteria bacterium]